MNKIISRTHSFKVGFFAALSLTSTVAMSNTVAIEGERAKVEKPATIICPAQFHSIKLIDDASQCQQFKTEIPAAMVYYSKHKPSDLISFYQGQNDSFKVHDPVNDRTLITSLDKQTRIVVSPDNAGSQIDILIASK